MTSPVFSWLFDTFLPIPPLFILLSGIFFFAVWPIPSLPLIFHPFLTLTWSFLRFWGSPLPSQHLLWKTPNEGRKLAYCILRRSPRLDFCSQFSTLFLTPIWSFLGFFGSPVSSAAPWDKWRLVARIKAAENRTNNFILFWPEIVEERERKINYI